MPLSRLLTTPTPPELRFTPRAGTLTAETLRQALPGTGRMSDLRLAVALLWHDHFEPCHALCQAHEGEADADYLHWILHRREADAANAAYWAAQVAGHGLLVPAGAAAWQLGLSDLAPQGALDPQLTTAASQTPATRAAALVALQTQELLLIADRLRDDGG